MYLCRAITEDNLHVRTDRLCTHADAATKEEARRFVEQKLGEIEISVDNLRAQIAGETYRLLPLSYIAEHYFGKSAAWLSQRLNGTLVRGRSYTLNEEQKKIFNMEKEAFVIWRQIKIFFNIERMKNKFN